METQYPHAAYIAMASQQPQQPQHHPFAGFPTQHPHAVSSAEQSTLPPLQHSAPHTFGHLPPMYSGAPPHAAMHSAQMPMPPHSAQGGHNSLTPANSGSMPPPPTTNSMPPQSVYAGSHVQSPVSGMPMSASMTTPQRAMAYSNTSPVAQFPPFNPATTLPGQHQTGFIPSQESEPTHVVGSQGRRGILPSVPGRPPVPASMNSATAKAVVPQKDADGKFPCPHCTKTYLHAKHLKRHMLRHTGDRPYMCHLCKDTFSRSDILKRHFQKCSIRRGNPSGQNHLAGQRRNTTSSVNRRSTGSNEALSLNGSVEMNGTPGSFTNGSMPNTVNGSPTVNGDGTSYQSSVNSMSARSSRANSLIHPNGSFGDRHGLTGLGLSINHNNDGQPVTSAPFGGALPAYNMRPHSASTPVHPSHYGYGSPPINGAMYQGMKPDEHSAGNYTAAGPDVMHSNRSQNGRNMEWNPMFAVHEHDGFVAQQHSQQHAQQQDQSHLPKGDEVMDEHGFHAAHAYGNSFLNSHTPTYGDDGSQ